MRSWASRFKYRPVKAGRQDLNLRPLDPQPEAGPLDGDGWWCFVLPQRGRLPASAARQRRSGSTAAVHGMILRDERLPSHLAALKIPGWEVSPVPADARGVPWSRRALRRRTSAFAGSATAADRLRLAVSAASGTWRA